jgi:dihydropteroate synthase
MQPKKLVRPEEIKRVIPLADGRQLALTRPLIMGILNVTPDSFSDGGKYSSTETAVEHALKMIEEGADIIDVGGESSRPGAEPVDAEEEIKRVLPVISQLRKQGKVPISVDTYKAVTAEAALGEGADIVNDISALRFDPNLAELAAGSRVPVILMHMLGVPRTMQANPTYEDCVAEIKQFFDVRIRFAMNAGIDKSKLIIDPGIGFGKRLSDNLDILADLREFRSFGLPVMIGASRKRFIGMLHHTGSPADHRLGGSIATAVTAVINGADIVRVHDIAETVEALKVVQAIREKA